MNDILHICSLNCQGLRQKEKQKRVNLWLKNQKCNIMYMQETHFTESMEKNLYDEFNCSIYHNFGSSQAKGVSILIKKRHKSQNNQ